MTSTREERLEELLAQIIKPLKGVPFEIVVMGLFGVRVFKFDVELDENRRILEKIANSMRSVCRAVQEKPIERNRVNEVGNDMEPLVITALQENSLDAMKPKSKSGKGKNQAYPDVILENGRGSIYIEVKTYSLKNLDSTQRTFYCSPSNDPKVHRDAYHLLVSFEIFKNGNKYYPIAFKIVDLYGLECDLKQEINSDNARLYDKKQILLEENIPME